MTLCCCLFQEESDRVRYCLWADFLSALPVYFVIISPKGNTGKALPTYLLPAQPMHLLATTHICHPLQDQVPLVEIVLVTCDAFVEFILLMYWLSRQTASTQVAADTFPFGRESSPDTRRGIPILQCFPAFPRVNPSDHTLLFWPHIYPSDRTARPP